MVNTGTGKESGNLAQTFGPKTPKQDEVSLSSSPLERALEMS